MKLKSILLLLLFIPSLVIAQTKSEDIKAAQQLIIGSFDDIWAGLDSTAVEEYHTDDFIILEQGEVWNNAEIKNYIKGALARGGNSIRTNSFDFIKTEHKGNSIWIAYHNYATWTENGTVTGNAEWLESAVAIKTGAGWKLQMMHSTRVRR